MNHINYKFLISFCNNRNHIDYNKGTGIIGLCSLKNGLIKYSELPLRINELNSINGATGICQNGNFYYVILQSNPSKLLVLDLLFNIVSINNLSSYKGVHSLCHYKGRLFAVATKHDKIIQINNDFVCEETYSFNHSNLDTLHLNSICVHNNSLCVSGFGDKNNNYWMHAKDGFAIELSSGKTIMSNLRQPHSLFSYNNQLFVCDSSRKRIIDSDFNILIKNKYGYTRGLYINDNIVVYGVSKGRRISVSTGDYIGNISDKGILDGECSINIKTKNHIKLSLKGVANEIYDIVPVF